ncbi:hypothetical protein PybrP1_004673 [[Pythium] brassicae (nom. inval.)]|nr:hypothetical protein PybrP1_004673 [[Pythium] brassicae (nom. inval.)]
MPSLERQLSGGGFIALANLRLDREPMSRYDETLRRCPLYDCSGMHESPGADELAQMWRRLRHARNKPIECRMSVMPRDLDRSWTALFAQPPAMMPEAETVEAHPAATKTVEEELKWAKYDARRALETARDDSPSPKKSRQLR